MDEEFMLQMELLRRESKIRMPVSSAVRCWNHNRRVSSSITNPPHVMKTFSIEEGPRCHALDVQIAGESAYRLIEATFDLHLRITGLGINQTGRFEKRFIHFDNLPIMAGCPRPRVWTY